MRIREYRPSDCGELAELFYHTVHRINARDYSQAQLDVWAPPQRDLGAWNRSFLDHHSLVAVENGSILGFGDIDSTGYLDRLYVHWAHQGKGIATALCDALEQAVDAPSFTTQASITARPFFEKRGYRVIQPQLVRRGGILLRNYQMEKQRTIAGAK